MWQTSPLGPFDAWPTGGGGFEHFYGFIGGETNQYYPAIYDGTTPVEPPKTPEQGYHFGEDMTDRAVAWVRQQKALTPDKPFFVYYAPGATHAPHHVPKAVQRPVQGPVRPGLGQAARGDLRAPEVAGRDPARRRAHRAARRDSGLGRLPDDLKPVLARQMEVYAGFLAHTDLQVGRLIDALADLDVLDDTLVYLHRRRQRRVAPRARSTARSTR